MLTQSKLGFGMMRLPKDENGKITASETEKLVDRFLDSGFTYFDTAYVYAGSEEAMKETLIKRHPRSSYTIADKLPAWSMKSGEDAKRIFNESLNRLGTDYFDFYLLHSIEDGNYETYKKFDCFNFVQQKKKEGKIRHAGFSFHGDAKLLEQVLSEHPEMEFVQLQINYLDWNNGVIQSAKCLEVARKHGKPVIVMEPVKGGTLAALSDESLEIFKETDPERSAAAWAIKFAASQPGVMTVLSGMNSLEQLDDNINTVKDNKGLSLKELDAIEKVREQILSFPTIPCTGCSYCTPGCPQEIEIPELFTAYNAKKTYGNSGLYDKYYKNHTKNGTSTASDCIECRQCESVCPQHLHIVDYLEDVSREFDKQNHQC